MKKITSILCVLSLLTSSCAHPMWRIATKNIARAALSFGTTFSGIELWKMHNQDKLPGNGTGNSIMLKAYSDFGSSVWVNMPPVQASKQENSLPYNSNILSLYHIARESVQSNELCESARVLLKTKRQLTLNPLQDKVTVRQPKRARIIEHESVTTPRGQFELEARTACTPICLMVANHILKRGDFADCSPRLIEQLIQKGSCLQAIIRQADTEHIACDETGYCTASAINEVLPQLAVNFDEVTVGAFRPRENSGETASGHIEDTDISDIRAQVCDRLASLDRPSCSIVTGNGESWLFGRLPAHESWFFFDSHRKNSNNDHGAGCHFFNTENELMEYLRGYPAFTYTEDIRDRNVLNVHILTQTVDQLDELLDVRSE